MPSPELLTRRVTLIFLPDIGLEDRVTAISGALCGVYPSVYLYAGQTSQEDILRSPGLKVDYTAVPQENDPAVWTASLNVFGLYDPAFGKNYENVMTITLMLDGAPTVIEVDLTEELSKAMAYFDGHLPIDIPLQLSIALSWNGIAVTCEVLPWSAGANRIEI
jgi:hypothetical protein